MQDFILSLDYLKDSQRHHEKGLFCLFEGSKLVDQGIGLGMTSTSKQSDLLKDSLIESPLHICEYKGQHYFTQELEAGTAEQSGLQTKTLREVAMQDEILFAILGRGLQLLNWRQNHRYCGHCGSVTLASGSEQAMHCGLCKRTYYPKIMPCVMALVTKGNQCLLAKHQRKAYSLYTALAGFIEAGESAEHAVYREVLEEVGIKTGTLDYFSSQPWPFPSQLMLAFFAEYVEGEIEPDKEEIADAQWFTASDLLESEIIPPTFTLSGQLIRAFIEANSR